MSRLSDFRHDRTLRLMQQAFKWADPPTFDALLEVAGKLRVDVRLPGEGRPQDQLAHLALLNVLARLPIGALRVFGSASPLATPLPPYRGLHLVDTVEDLCSRLDVSPEIETSSTVDEWTLTVSSPFETTTWGMALDGSNAYLGVGRPDSSIAFDPVGCYTLASMAGGEILKAWSRSAEATGAGKPSPQFAARARQASERWLDLHDGEWRADRAPADAAAYPEIDWVSCGAVNQAALAVLAAHPGVRPRGTVFDPGELDAPDLNRSLLSFVEDLGLPKAQVGAAVAGDLAWQQGRYPDALDVPAAPWIVCGTDDPSIRPECQRLRPQRLVVTGTEDVFGFAAWHAREARDVACAACDPAPALDTTEPIATSAPTSVIAGVAAAALLVRLAAGDEPAHRTNLLTLRLDSPLAVERVNPRRSPDCEVCSEQAA